jgi:hypothetical protein
MKPKANLRHASTGLTALAMLFSLSCAQTDRRSDAPTSTTIPAIVSSQLSLNEIEYKFPDGALAEIGENASVEALIDQVYGAVVGVIVESSPEDVTVPIEPPQILQVWKVQVVEPIFGGARRGEVVKMVLGTTGIGNPETDDKTYQTGERLVLFYKHNYIERPGFDDLEFPGINSGVFRYTGALRATKTSGEKSYEVKSQGPIPVTTEADLIEITRGRVASQGNPLNTRIEQPKVGAASP